MSAGAAAEGDTASGRAELVELVELILALVPELDDGAGAEAWYRTHCARALELTSLQVVQLVDLIEATFELVLTSADVVRENFVSAGALVAHLERRGAL